MSNPKQILLDLTQELQSEFLSDTFEVRGRKWEMKLLNEEQTSWSFGLIKANNQIELALSSRLATMAIGIRSINSVSIEDMFKDDYANQDEMQSELYKDLPYSLALAQMFYNYLKEAPPSFIGELHEKWTELEMRRAEAQKELKNSSRESSDSEENES